MMSTSSAEGPLKIGKERLLSRYPLFGGLVATWRCIPDASTVTVSIGMSANGFDLRYNPEFISSLPMDQLEGVLHHEARHVVYEHVFMQPEDYPDGEALTIAQEVTANENLPEPLPKGAIRLHNYPALKPNTSTVSRYGKLARPTKNIKQGGSASSPLGKGQPDGKGSGKDGVQSGGRKKTPNQGETAAGKEEGGKGADPGADQGDGRKEVRGRSAAIDQGEQKQEGETAKGQLSAPKTVDDHSRWQGIRKQESVARWIVDSVMQEVMGREAKLTEEEQIAIHEMCKQRGIEPGEYYSQLDPKQTSQQVSWKTLLRRYVGRELHSQPTYARPPRRFPQLLGVVPGKIRRADRPRILAAIDTSGSMTDETLAEISLELTYMTRDNEVIVAECDAEIHRVYRYTKSIKEVHGRGGTSFKPVLDRAFLAKQKADLVVLFTDGDGDAPEKSPRVPVVWVIVGDGKPPVNWGRVVRMESQRK